MLDRKSDETLKWIKLEEIWDLHWPVDRELVRSFRSTLQQGNSFNHIKLNLIGPEDDTHHYEVIDGFHRLAAAKAEHIDALLCQVVKLEEKDARDQRIQACIGKPSAVTAERALLELRSAFVEDMQDLIGQPGVLYEPILGEDGQVQARQRTAPLPEDPYMALEALTDHLLATRSAYPADRVEHKWGGWALRTPFGRRTGWERALNDWLSKMSKQFGFDTSWLLELLHLQLFDNFLGPRRWYRRRGQALFSEEQDYAEFAYRIWQIPDVDLRALFRRRLEDQPDERSSLAKVQDLLQLNGFPEPGQTRTGPNKQEILKLFTDYPSANGLYGHLRKRQQEALPEPDDLPVQPPALSDHLSQPAGDEGSSIEPPKAEAEERDSAVFTVISRDKLFPESSHAPTPIRNSLPSAPPEADQVAAYQPVHEACEALLDAAQHLTEQYGTAWLQWESARADIAQLQALFGLK